MNSKKLFVSLFAITFVATGCASKVGDRQGWSQDWTLHGDVKSVTLTRYNMYENVGEEASVITYDFNERGDVVKESGQDNGFPMIWENTYKYDSHGNRIKTAYYGENSKPYHQTEIRIVYSDNIF